MSKYTLNAEVSYKERKINFSALYTGQPDDPNDNPDAPANSLSWIVKSPEGLIVSTSIAPKTDEYQGMASYCSSHELGLRVGGLGLAHKSTTTLAYNEMMLSWKPSNTNTAAYIIETGYIPNSVYITQKANAYSGVPVLITRGDSCLQAKVEAVAGGNYITWNPEDKSITPLGGTFDYSNSIIEVTSGTYSGQTARITSTNNSLSGFYVDKNVYDWSGAFIKVMPRRWIQENTSWQRPIPSIYVEAQTGNITTEFTLSAPKPTGMGFAYKLTGYFQTHPAIDVYQVSQGVGGLGLFNVTGTKVMIDRAKDNKDIQVGDVVYYPSYADHNVINSGVVLVSNVADDGNLYITYYPSGRPASSSPDNGHFNVHRADHFTLETFPNFDRDYTIHAYEAGVGQVGMGKFKTPSASIQFSANEHESTYATVSDQAHFHIGPVVLSNGEYLDDSKFLYISGKIESGDVTNPTVVADVLAAGSQDPAIGHNFSGTYYRNGILTISTNTSFNAAETLFVTVLSTYGSARVENVITVPVQPSV